MNSILFLKKQTLLKVSAFFSGLEEIRLIKDRLGPALAGNARPHCI